MALPPLKLHCAEADLIDIAHGESEAGIEFLNDGLCALFVFAKLPDGGKISMDSFDGNHGDEVAVTVLHGVNQEIGRADAFVDIEPNRGTGEDSIACHLFNARVGRFVTSSKTAQAGSLQCAVMDVASLTFAIPKQANGCYIAIVLDG